MKKRIASLNEWLASNNITDIVIKPKKSEYFGTVCGIYEIGEKRDTCIFYSPALGELVENICVSYGISKNTVPQY